MADEEAEMELQPYATNAVDNDDAGGKADPEEYDNAYLGPGDAAPASPAALPPVLDVSSRLNELEAVLRQPDSVMEPTILDSLREYVLSQGQPQQAVEFLTESYVGYAQMASLACSWLKLVDDRTGNEALDATTPEQAMPPISSAAAGSNPPSHSVMQPPREGSPAEGPVVRARTPGATPLAEMDEAYFLRSLAFERYDPQKFANIFSAGGSGAPKWLNALIDDPDGRQLIYKLSTTHQNSLLLNFAVHKILMQPGRDTEVAAVGASLVGFFGVYHRLLGVRLRQAASSGNQAELERLAREMAEGASRSQHAYVHAQQVLTELAGDAGPWASRFRRLSQEIEASVPGPAVWKMQRWFAPPGDAATAAAALVSDILAVAAGGNLAPSADVIKLARLYNAPSLSSEGCLVPPVSIVRHPRLIEVLLQGLFTAGKQLQEEAQAAHISVLAMAVAAQDVDGQDLPPLENQPAVVAARQALRTTSAAAHKALREELLTDEEREEVEAALAERCCGVGVMRMLRSRITSPSYWTSVVHLHKEAPYVPLLHAAVRQQPKMLSDIFSLVRDALSAAGHSGRGSDVVVGLMKVAVAVALAGRLEDVLKWADQWARGADAPLVRQFVYGIFEGAAPPYSPFFAAAMLRLLVAAGGRKAIGTRELAGRAPLLSEFVEGCRQVKFETPLSPSESTCLKDLESALRVNHKK